MRRSTERRMFFLAALICPYFLNRNRARLYLRRVLLAKNVFGKMKIVAKATQNVSALMAN